MGAESRGSREETAGLPGKGGPAVSFPAHMKKPMNEVRVGFAQVTIIRDGHRLSRTVYVREAASDDRRVSFVRIVHESVDSQGRHAGTYGPRARVQPTPAPVGQVVDIFC